MLKTKLTKTRAAELGIGVGSLNASERTNLIEVIKRLRARGEDPAEAWVADLGGSRAAMMKSMCPTLTRTRSQSGGFWMTWLGRKMTTNEILRLQGIHPHSIPCGLVSERQVRGAAGNSIPVPLLARVLQGVLPSVGYKV